MYDKFSVFSWYVYLFVFFFGMCIVNGCLGDGWVDYDSTYHVIEIGIDELFLIKSKVDMIYDIIVHFSPCFELPS